MSGTQIEHWLDLYGGRWCDWHQLSHDGTTSFARRLGIVESFFDHDGINFVGRADVTCLLTLEIESRLSSDALRTRILLAWAVLRARHALMRARAVDAEHTTALRDGPVSGRCFVVDEPRNIDSLVREAEGSIAFVAEHVNRDDAVDPRDFYRHTLNTGRCFNAEESLSRLFVLPEQKAPNGKLCLHTVMVVAHEISDGDLLA